MHRIGLAFVAIVSICVWLAMPAGASGSVSAVPSVGAPAEAVSAQRVGAAPTSTCSTPLRLYDGTNLTGASVAISERFVWVNLSTLGFDNRTSSFKVGACAIDMASAANGGGALYETCLTAGCEEDTMDLGWNNVISSVYLH